MGYSAAFNSNVPGMQGEVFYDDRQICINADYHIQDRIPITIAANSGNMYSGTILGFDTTNKLAHPVTRATVAVTQPAVAPAAQVIALKVAGTGAMFQNGQTVSSMKADGTGVQALGTITAINGDNITVATALGTELADGDYFYVSDGSQTAAVLLAETVLNATTNQISFAYIAGKFYGSMLIGLDAIASKDLGVRSVPLGKTDTMVII